jgi:hypothetical protein
MATDELKQKFLVLYDYGQGGRWAIVSARSQEEITGQFPELEVVAGRPDWMTDEYYRNLESRGCDIDRPTGLLVDIVEERNRA